MTKKVSKITKKNENLNALQNIENYLKNIRKQNLANI